MSSCCVICCKDFTPGKRSAKLETAEQKEYLENFLKLKVPEEEWMGLENIDFGTQLPFCKNCFGLTKQLSQDCSSKEVLEEELVALQEKVFEKVKELSTFMDESNSIFRQIQEQVGQSRNVEAKKMEVRRSKRGRPNVGRVEDVRDDPSVVGVSASRREDGKVERLRELILKWTPANQQNQNLQDDEGADKTDSGTMGGIMKEDLVSDGLSSSTLTSNKGRGVSRKQKAMDMIPSKTESTCVRDEPL